MKLLNNIALVGLLSALSAPSMAAQAPAYKQAIRYSTWAEVCASEQRNLEDGWQALSKEMAAAAITLLHDQAYTREQISEQITWQSAWASGYLAGAYNNPIDFCESLWRTWSEETGWILTKAKAVK
ncbi:hypothetical protein [Aeromonas caviae]|uniref:hypothetical protein n=1 Tax=Aeromonas caviae TaxID=648 RepID=UPI00225B6B6E|nr:hypothetical protein [Aeromonas caviae]MCX4072428.1 hypothetical protein [Aeromonas caviae]